MFISSPGPMTTIKAILFDKDGTLVDFNRTWRNLTERLALEAAGGNHSQASALLELAGFDPVTDQFRADSPIAAGTSADIVGLWYPHLAAEPRREVVARFDAICVEQSVAGAVALEGVVSALADLHASGFRLGIVTNDSTLGAEKTVEAFGVAQMFDAIFGYDAVARPKPAPDAAEAFCDLTGLRPAQIAVVGDNRHDLDLARNVGAGLAIAVLSGNGTSESLTPHADAVLPSVADLPAYLNDHTIE